MGKADLFSVQAKPRAGRQCITVCVEIITQNRMPQKAHMNAQLMAAPGQWRQLDPRIILHGFNNLPVRDRGAAIDRINMLLGTVGPVGNQGLVNAAGRRLHLSPHVCDIGFLDLSLFKLTTDMNLGGGRQGHNNNAGRVHIEPVNDTRRRIVFSSARLQTIGPLGHIAGHGQKTGRLVEHQDMVVDMDYRQSGIGRRRIDKGARLYGAWQSDDRMSGN